MKCWSDQTLHWAVRRLLDTGTDARAALAGSGPLPIGSPSSLRETMEHIRGCASCARKAHELLETELELLAMEQVEQVLSLVPVPSWSPSTQADPVEEPEPSEYAVAADSCGADRRIILDGHGAISLSSKDGHYLVRIFRNEKGEGATAVLLQTRDQDDACEGETGPAISLSIDGKDYTFDSSGTARLPAFPALPPSLLLRLS